MSSDRKSSRILAEARRVIDLECANIQRMKRRLGTSFVRAVRALQNCRGKVVVTGIGKSGIIGRKICATLASTGTPSAFLHPGEAVHGDLGMVTARDVVLTLSNSGETEELLRILPSLRKIGACVVSITASERSSLAQQSDITIATGPMQEADLFTLIPSSSTTCALVLGDAIALTLLMQKGFQKDSFAFLHPGGDLGRRLMLRVRDVMKTGRNIPTVRETDPLPAAIREIDRKNLGFALVLDARGRLAGIITDGDLRRRLARHTDLSGCTVPECMTRNPRTIDKDKLAAQALAAMEEREITCLVILDSGKRPEGIVHLHDLLGKKEFRFES